MNIQSIGAKQTNAVAFKAKVPTEDVIQVAAHQLFPEGAGRGIDGVYDVCEKMTNRFVRRKELAEVSNQCQNVLLVEFPALKTIVENSRKFFDGTKRTIEQIKAWKDEQVALFGSKEIDVPEFRADESAILKARKTYRGLPSM